MDQETQTPQVMHFGRYHQITPDQARLDKKILRSLFRRGFYRGLTRGQLANFTACRKVDLAFKDSLARLIELRLVEFGPAVHDDAQMIMLTPAGQMWAEECVSAVQSRGEQE